ASLSSVIFGHWKAFGDLNAAELSNLFVPAITLAVLLSIDTLKTCLVLDTLTRSRHKSNRELIGQGLGNMVSSLIGGIPGAGTMGATLVNISSGGQTRLSGIIEGVLALVVFLILGSLIAWVPIAALSGILIVIGFRMLDRHSLVLLKARSTVLDFFVIVAVVVVALTVSLIAASATGIALAIMLFIREQIRGSIIHNKAYGNHMFSKQVRLPEEMEILEKYGDRTVIFELQGSLFFGTTDKLYTSLEPEFKSRSYVIIDMRRVLSVDITAAHMLEQIEAMLADNKAFLIFSRIPKNVSGGPDLRKYFDQIGEVKLKSHLQTFDELDDALEWVENRIIEDVHLERMQEKPLELREIDLFKRRKDKTLEALESCMEKCSYKAGDRIFVLGDTGDDLFLIRRGTVRIVLPLEDKQSYHLATFGRGDFFGEMAFLDGAARSADAVAFTDTDLFVLSRKRFDALADEHKKLAVNLMEGIARVLAIRLRYANTELRALHMS
ncbi:MAG: SulP family inorganic anion transporter, partial [Kiritimatiellae bacterium]|nr:SulP family inorganic anion transporter [Kiritimatiellia bacterium]